MDLRLADGCSPSFFRLSRFQCPVRADEATAAARKRNKSFLTLLRSMSLRSGAIEGPVEVGLLVCSPCTGVLRRWHEFVVRLCAFRYFASRNQGMLEVMRKMGGRIELEHPSVATVVDGECSSGIWEAWGAAPVDGRPPKASSTATPLKASVQWGFFRSTAARGSSSTAVSGNGDLRRRRQA